jgi:hypothetical protein
VVCGFTKGKGSRKYFGALLLGAYGNGKLHYLGHAGTGFTEKGNERNNRALKPLCRFACSSAGKLRKASNGHRIRKVSKHCRCLDTFSIHPCAVVTFHKRVPRRIEWLGKLVHKPLCGS